MGLTHQKTTYETAMRDCPQSIVPWTMGITPYVLNAIANPVSCLDLRKRRVLWCK